MKKFGLQLYSVRDRFYDEESTKEAFFRIREMGYTYAQTAGTYDYIAPERFYELAKENGIELFSTHYDYEKIKNDVLGTVNYHKTIGAEYIGIGGAGGEFTSKENILAFIKEYNELSKIYKEYGFKLTYHNHSREFVKIDGKIGFEYLIEGFDKENITFCLDTYWAHQGGVDVARLIRRLKGRIDIIHLKDIAPCFEYELSDGGKLLSPHYVELGRGNTDFPYIVEVAKKAGTKYFVVEDEYYSTGDSMESIKISADYIKNNLM